MSLPLSVHLVPPVPDATLIVHDYGMRYQHSSTPPPPRAPRFALGLSKVTLTLLAQSFKGHGGFGVILSYPVCDLFIYLFIHLFVYLIGRERQARVEDLP